MPDASYSFNNLEFQVCSDYWETLSVNLVLGNGIMVAIIVINLILKYATIYLITWIGYDTHSELMTKITNGVFIALFFNTAILLLLTNANLSDVSGALGKLFKGTFYDYQPRWYATVGNTLVNTMILNAFMPPVYEAITNALAWLSQSIDNGWRCCKPKKERDYFTKKTQIYQYLELYTGPDYIVHYKYSGVLNITFVTMMYGFGLPMLFPIAFVSYFVIWATERYQLAYTYQLPPAMDDKMTQNAMSLLSYTPLLFLLNGYWMLSNRQMFENLVNHLTYSTEQMSSGHSLNTVFQMDQATPMLLIAVVIFFITILRSFFPQTMAKWGYVISSNVIEVDENLPNFFNAVKLSDADWFVSENNNMRDSYKFTFASKDVIDRLDDKD